MERRPRAPGRPVRAAGPRPPASPSPLRPCRRAPTCSAPRPRCLGGWAPARRLRGRGSETRRPGWGCTAGAPAGRPGPGSRERGSGGRRKWGRGGDGHPRSPPSRPPRGAPSGAAARTSRPGEKFPARILAPRPATLVCTPPAARPQPAARALGSARSDPLAAPRPGGAAPPRGHARVPGPRALAAGDSWAAPPERTRTPGEKAHAGKGARRSREGTDPVPRLRAGAPRRRAS